MSSSLRIVTVLGARPQFIKAAVVSRALQALGDVEELLVHTGQHFDSALSRVFFDELELPTPALNLGIAGLSHGAMTGRMLEALEAAFLQLRPVGVLVYGDTNTTLAAALAAAKLNLPVAHVEAGLRSFNRAMPEEINRVVTDHLASILFAPTEVAVRNLRHEGIRCLRVVRTGDVMFDAALQYGARAEAESPILANLGLAHRGYVLATVHRQENTDAPERLHGILAAFAAIAREVPVVLPLHPRTRNRIAQDPVAAAHLATVRTIDPVGYLDMIRLERGARCILTDSGGVQKEAFFHGVPCVTLRDETEWTELVRLRANRLAGASTRRIVAACRKASATTVPAALLYGDGTASALIARTLAERWSAPGA